MSLLAQRTVPMQLPVLVKSSSNPSVSPPESESVNLLSLTSVKKMTIAPKISPPKKVVVSPPEVKMGNYNNQKKESPPRSSQVSPGPVESRKSRLADPGSLKLKLDAALHDPGAPTRGGRYGAAAAAAAGGKKVGGSHLSPVRRHSTTDKKSIEDVVRANLKSMREASSSANTKNRKFDVNSVARTAVKTMRSSKALALKHHPGTSSVLNSESESDASPSPSRPKSMGATFLASGNIGDSSRRSGIPKPRSSSNRDRERGSSSNSDSESDTSDVGGGIGGALLLRSGPGVRGASQQALSYPSAGSNSSSSSSSSSNTVTTDFQAACKARVMRKQKELLARFKEQTAVVPGGGGAGESRYQESARLRKAENAIKDEERRKKRAQVYAINAYLKGQEQLRFKLFLAAQQEEESRRAEQGRSGVDDDDNVSWCSNDSSVMPTPRYRSERERNYLAENQRKTGESSASESDSERSGNDHESNNPLPLSSSKKSKKTKTDPLRMSVGGGV